jgi:hypothetical protein
MGLIGILYYYIANPLKRFVYPDNVSVLNKNISIGSLFANIISL